MNKKYAVFGVAAVIAVAGVIYFGTSANQQASVAALNLKTASDTTNTISTGIGPITTNPNDPSWIKLCRDKKPHLQVLSPNGGEVYQAGQQVTVKWRSCNILGNVSEINLTSTRDNGWGPGSGPNAGKYTFVTNTENDGQQDVTLPTSTNFMSVGASFGQYFKVEVIATGANDSSNNLFTINRLPSAGNANFNPTSSSTEVTRDTSGRIISATFINNYSVTAENSDIYLPRTCTLDGSGSTSSSTVYTYESQNGTPTLTDHACSSTILSGATLDSQGRIVVPNGYTIQIRLISVVKNIGSIAITRQKIKSFNYWDELNTPLIYIVPTPNNFATSYITF
jgi:hypothetical protein